MGIFHCQVVGRYRSRHRLPRGPSGAVISWNEAATVSWALPSLKQRGFRKTTVDGSRENMGKSTGNIDISLENIGKHIKNDGFLWICLKPKVKHMP